MLMVVGKIISIFDISIEVILSSDTVKIGDILVTQDSKDYTFEVYMKKLKILQ